MTINETLKSKKDQAIKLVQEIINVKNDIEEIKIDAKKIHGNIVLNNDEYKKLVLTLNNINTTTSDAIINFRKEREKIKTLLNQVNRYYDKTFIPLTHKIDDKENGLKTKISNTSQDLKQLEKIKLNCGKQYDEIKNSVLDYRVKVRELKTIDTSIRKLHSSTGQNKNKSDLLFTSIKNIEKESKSLLVSNRKYNTESKNLSITINSLEVKSQSLLTKIKANHSISDEKLIAIQKIYDIAHETGLSGEFENRRNNLKIELDKWERNILQYSKILLASLIALFLFQLWLYDFNIVANNFDYNFYIRFLILSPIVYYLVFCSTQYSKIQKLHDKYSFKTTLAMSIKSHIELLTKEEHFQSDGAIDSILDFIIDGFRKIYNEPYADDDFKIKIKLANIKLDLQKNLIDNLKTKKNN
jgi:hypothetical protein